MTSAPATQPKKPSGIQWPIFIISLLGMNVIVVAITIVSAVRNPAHVEPDYYNKALNWDESRGITDDTD
ncbi:MAG: FixH family protein [Planctomycetota bacterium]